MYRITLWNRNSTNFGQNSFVRLNGTESFDIQVEANALACMMIAVRTSSIQGATMEGPGGTLSWQKTPAPTSIEDFPDFPTTSHSDPADECDYNDEECDNFCNDCDPNIDAIWASRICPDCGLMNRNCACPDIHEGSR